MNLSEAIQASKDPALSCLDPADLRLLAVPKAQPLPRELIFSKLGFTAAIILTRDTKKKVSFSHDTRSGTMCLGMPVTLSKIVQVQHVSNFVAYISNNSVDPFVSRSPSLREMASLYVNVIQYNS